MPVDVPVVSGARVVFVFGMLVRFGCVREFCGCVIVVRNCRDEACMLRGMWSIRSVARRVYGTVTHLALF